jgi:hypothetical protein
MHTVNEAPTDATRSGFQIPIIGVNDGLFTARLTSSTILDKASALSWPWSRFNFAK